MVSQRQTGQNWSKTVVAGLVGGFLAFVSGFAVIYLRKADTIQRDVLGTVGELGQMSAQVKPPSPWQVIGWLQYAAHNVDIVVEVSGLGRSSSGQIPLTEGILWERWFVLLPVLTLLIAGFVVAFVVSASNVTDGFLAGSSVALGYGLLAIGGVIGTAWTTSISYRGLSVSGSVGPDPATGILLAGVVYPVLIGGIGGIVASAVTGERDNQS